VVIPKPLDSERTFNHQHLQTSRFCLRGFRYKGSPWTHDTPKFHGIYEFQTPLDLRRLGLLKLSTHQATFELRYIGPLQNIYHQPYFLTLGSSGYPKKFPSCHFYPKKFPSCHFRLNNSLKEGPQTLSLVISHPRSLDTHRTTNIRPFLNVYHLQFFSKIKGESLTNYSRLTFGH
jgi:hypothetical protein